jgi:hypothetical protein
VEATKQTEKEEENDRTEYSVAAGVFNLGSFNYCLFDSRRNYFMWKVKIEFAPRSQKVSETCKENFLYLIIFSVV